MSDNPTENELARLEALLRYDILDTLPEASYNDIVQLACQLCGTPMAAVTFVDRHRQWFKSRVGIPVCETPRDVSFCSRAIAQDEPVFEIPDARADERFCENPLVTGPLQLRFYAGATIVDRDGHKLGAVCVLDRVPRRLSPEQRGALTALARLAAELLHERSAISQLAERNRFRHFLENSPVVAFLKEANGPILYVNQTFYKLFGRNQETVIGKSYAEVWPEEFARGMPAQHEEVLHTGRPVVAEYMLSRDLRTQQFWQLYMFPVADGSTTMIGGIAIDVSSDRRKHQRLEKELDRLGILSNTDALTGVANRRALDERLKAEVDFSKRHKEPLSFLMVDIDRFKQFNDRFGHLAGDRLLASIAQTLVENARLHDIVARYGGEEFGVILRHTNLQSAAVQAERLRAAVERMPPKDITISIGVAEFDGAHDDFVPMVHAADTALYTAKNAGRNRIAVAGVAAVAETRERSARQGSARQGSARER